MIYSNLIKSVFTFSLSLLKGVPIWCIHTFEAFTMGGICAVGVSSFNVRTVDRHNLWSCCAIWASGMAHQPIRDSARDIFSDSVIGSENTSNMVAQWEDFRPELQSIFFTPLRPRDCPGYCQIKALLQSSP